MNQHERAGFEAALRGERRDAFPGLPEDPADWRRGWDRGTRVFERAVDVVREVMHTFARCQRERDALVQLRALHDAIGYDATKGIRELIETTEQEAWRRVRPALRELIASAHDAARDERGTEPAEQLYYVRCTEGAHGDSMLWWGPGRCGYTTVLERAGLYTESEARSICRIRPPIEIAYRREDVERAAQRQVTAGAEIPALQWEAG